MQARRVFLWSLCGSHLSNKKEEARRHVRMIGLGLRRRLASLTDRNAPMSKPDRTLHVAYRPLEALIPVARDARTHTAEQVTLVAFGKSYALWRGGGT